MPVALRSLLAVLLCLLPLLADAAGPDFDALEQRLKLRPEQKEQFRAASRVTQRALVSSAMAAMELKTRLGEELSKPRPDFAALFAAQEAAIAMNRPLFREARDEWVKLYALLDEEQIAVAKRYLKEQLGSLPTLGLTP